MMFHRLAGYSGADVLLATTPDGARFVRKHASSPAYNGRLQEQARLQRAFAAMRDRPFLVPAVLAEGQIGDLAYFDMEYIEAISAPAFLAGQSVPALRAFRDNIVSTLSYLSSQQPASATTEPAAAALAARVARVADTNAAFATRHAPRVLALLDGCHRLGAGPQTLCHGDFSLENMLMTPQHELVLLDFLDGPWSHYWQDASKLHVDLDAHWYGRRFPMISQWVISYLKEGVAALMAERRDGYERWQGVLLAVNLARILPYVTSSAHERLLLAQLDDHLAALEVAA